MTEKIIIPYQLKISIKVWEDGNISLIQAEEGTSEEARILIHKDNVSRLIEALQDAIGCSSAKASQSFLGQQYPLQNSFTGGKQ